MTGYEQMVKRQRTLADFGDLALQSEDLDNILAEACRHVSQALGTKRAKVLELLHEEDCLLVRAGVGWNPSIVGHLRLPMNERSSETFSIKMGEPVITPDISKEERFELPAFIREAGVVAMVNVPIILPGGRAFGLLQVDAQEPRDFGSEDTEFLRTYAGILGPVIDRLLQLDELRETRQRFRFTVEEARDYAIFITDTWGRIVDWLPGAEAVFGWTAEEVIGQSAATLFTFEDRDAGDFEKEIETASIQGSVPSVRALLCKDGSRKFIEGSIRALRDPSGTVNGFLKIGQDVTERRRAETQLQESEARQRALIDGLPQLVWRSTSEGGWTWSSPQWVTYTGQSVEASQGHG